MKRSQLIEILSEQRSELARTYSVKSLALFGSVARDQSTPASAGQPQTAHPRARDERMCPGRLEAGRSEFRRPLACCKGVLNFLLISDFNCKVEIAGWPDLACS